MVSINKLLVNLNAISIIGNKDIFIKKIYTNSKQINKDDLFIAIIGTNIDGHNFIEQAINKGAKAIVCNIKPEKINIEILYIVVADTNNAAGILLNNFYNNLTEKINLIGITGTNGKTSTATLLFKLFKKLGDKAGLISTVCNYINDKEINATHTTPDIVSLYDLLNQMYLDGCKYVFMECSSHAIFQQRISGLKFKICVFTNITHDHLDYHLTFEKYFAAKKMLFDNLDIHSYAISNIDDKKGNEILLNTNAKKIFYGINNKADFKGNIISNSLNGLTIDINENKNIYFKLIGKFNAYNLLAVYTTAILLGKKPEDILNNLKSLTSAPGRFEIIVSENKNIYGIIDYAHTPDALENVLKTLNETKNQNQKIITIIGCGGNRDKLKRPIMAKIAYHNSNLVIYTSDNPRYEDPQNILNEMKNGLKDLNLNKTFFIIDRKKAIEFSIEKAISEDIILIAGKGHEEYQEIEGIKQHFNDKEILINLFKRFKS